MQVRIPYLVTWEGALSVLHVTPRQFVTWHRQFVTWHRQFVTWHHLPLLLGCSHFGENWCVDFCHNKLAWSLTVTMSPFKRCKLLKLYVTSCKQSADTFLNTSSVYNLYLLYRQILRIMAKAVVTFERSPTLNIKVVWSIAQLWALP